MSCDPTSTIFTDKGAKKPITKSLLNKHAILACKQIGFSMQKKISYHIKVSRIFNQLQLQLDNPCSDFVQIFILKKIGSI